MDLTEKIARAICEADGLDPDEVSQVLQPVHKRLQNWRVAYDKLLGMRDRETKAIGDKATKL